MKTLKQYNKSSNELQQLDEGTRQELIEISLGKISTTVLIGRLKLLTRKIKDTVISKSLMSLGYMIYTVSLQSKSLDEVDKKLDQIIRKQNQQDNEIRLIRNKTNLL
jgi:hypothetical protein